MKKFFILILSVFLMFSTSISTYANENITTYTSNIEEVYVKGKVLEVLERTENDFYTETVIDVMLLDEPFRGEIATFRYNDINGVYPHIDMQAGIKLLLLVEHSDEVIYDIVVYDALRTPNVTLMIGIVCLLLIVIGKVKGLKSVISISITMGAIFYILLPLLIRGYSPVLITILVSIIIITLTHLLVTGTNKKTLAAIIGTTSGLLLAGIIGFITIHLAHLSGMGTEEEMLLINATAHVAFNMKGILLAGIMISALGAIMDVSVSISSAIHEIYTANPTVRTKDLFKSGMNVGQDIMGTMCNTLILAYTGGMIPFMMLIMLYDTPLSATLNSEFMISEIIRALVGTFALILMIPVTAFVSSYLCKSTTLPGTNSKVMKKKQFKA